jgi:hypothetical protein
MPSRVFASRRQAEGYFIRARTRIRVGLIAADLRNAEFSCRTRPGELLRDRSIRGQYEEAGWLRMYVDRAISTPARRRRCGVETT